MPSSCVVHPEWGQSLRFSLGKDIFVSLSRVKTLLPKWYIKARNMSSRGIADRALGYTPIPLPADELCIGKIFNP